MAKAACHCMAVRFEVDPPQDVFDCNCTLCRRYGAIWAYYRNGGLKLLSPPDATFAYTWQNGGIGFHHCKICGCTTHLQANDVAGKPIFAINARLIPTLDPASVRLRQLENSHTNWFWTKSNDPPIPSRHPKMAMPGPDDWR
jgi:hypothetical protein